MSNKNPIVSVIMPCLNAADTITQAIESVLQQGFKSIELIIIDDGSFDLSLLIINKFQSVDSRVKLLINSGEKGVSFARNIGLNSAKGKYICFLDSDDYMLPGSIDLRVKVAFEKNAKIVYGPYLKLMPNGEFYKKNVPKKIFLKNMLKKNYIGNLAGMYNTEAIGKVFQKDVGHEDYLMWCNLIRLAECAYSTGFEPVAVYRVSPHSLSGNKFKAFLWHWNVIRHDLGVNFISCIYYQSYYFIAALCERINFINKLRLK